MPSTQPARGTRDFLPADVRRREYVIDIVREVYERYGFEPLETPAFENIETLLGKYGEEGNKLVFKILKRGEQESSGQADLALRYDLTVPLARVVAEHQATLPKFFRRYQIQPVWRADRPARGRFREFYQCDIDAMGSTSPVVEAEMISAVNEVLGRLDFSDFTIRINHRQILSALLTNAFVPADKHASVLVILDKRDKIGEQGVLDELERSGVERAAATRIFNWLGAAWGPDWLDWLQAQFALLDDAGAKAFQNLREIFHLLQGSPAAARLRFEPSLARGLSYYTGAIMEISVDGIGSLGGGGRYDNLIGMFLGRDIPACGFSLGLERIIVVMTEQGKFPASVRGPAEILVAMWNDQSRADALALARDLRQGGLSVDLYPDSDKPGKQFKYAAGRHCRFVALAGDDEQRDGTVAVKNLETGAQATVPRQDVVRYLTEMSARTGKDRE